MDNELILFDRLEVIKATIKKYDINTFYHSFSGGKDSMVVHTLLDIAIPGNRIPRVYANTGIEYNDMVEFVKELQKTDDRIQIIKPSKNIKQTLEEKGYPFKSKQYSSWYQYYEKNKKMFTEYRRLIEENPTLADNYDFIHNLPRGIKWEIKEYFGKREKNGELLDWYRLPDILRYQFEEDLNFKISDQCCFEMKEKPLDQWKLKTGFKNTITGLMRAEGGRRSGVNCILVKPNKVSFHPLAKVSLEWEEWFVNEYKVPLCKLYKEPYNFKRTGCKGCPFSLQLQEQLETMEKYMPAERKQCELIWKPVYDEYRRIGYRLKKNEQMKLF